MKACTQCQRHLALSDFYKQGNRLRSMCKDCYAAHNSSQRVKHAEKRNAYDKSRGAGWGRSGRERYRGTPDEKHDSYLKRTYNLNLAAYNAMLAAQGGVCAVCGEGCNRTTTERLNVDHDHSTGHVRGLLCFKCNVGLGRFNDSQALLRKAIDYLDKAARHPGKTLYLSGPMSGIKDLNFPAFHAEAARLRAMGYDIVNPAEINIDPNAGWLACMRADIKQLVDCDGVATLPGWVNSRGASLEVGIAHGLGLPVHDAASIER